MYFLPQCKEPFDFSQAGYQYSLIASVLDVHLCYQCRAHRCHNKLVYPPLFSDYDTCGKQKDQAKVLFISE